MCSLFNTILRLPTVDRSRTAFLSYNPNSLEGPWNLRAKIVFKQLCCKMSSKRYEEFSVYSITHMKCERWAFHNPYLPYHTLTK